MTETEEDYNSRIQAIEESMDWRAELENRGDDIARIVFAENGACQEAMSHLLFALRYDDDLKTLRSDLVDSLLDQIASAIDPKVTIPFRWEVNLRKAFKQWRQDRAIELEKEGR